MRVSGSLEKGIISLSRALNWVSSAIFAVMMFLVSVHVLMRYFVHRPIRGTYELIDVMLVIGVFFSIAHTQVIKGHVFISLIKYPPRALVVINTITTLLSLGIAFLMGWRAIVQAREYYRLGLVTTGLEIPFYPFLWVVGVGCFVLCLVLLVDLFHPRRREVKK